jgi:hypothetical protein
MRRANAFSDENTLDQAILSIRAFQKFKKTGGAGISDNEYTMFAEVTEIVEDSDSKEVKATEKVWNSATPDWAIPERDAIQFDSDSDQGVSYNTTNIFCPEPVAVGDHIRVIFYPDRSRTSIWIGIPIGAGSTRTMISTPYTGQEFGGSYDFPGGTFTAFTETTSFFIVTPWGSRVAVPADQLAWGYRGLADKIGDAYYLEAKDIFIKPLEIYPNSGNITDFEIYFSRSDSSLKLGDTDGSTVPTGSEAKHEGYDNANSNSNSRGYYNNKVFQCGYDPVQNLFLIDHPIFGP